MMKAEGGKDLLFIGYVVIVIAMAVVYFAVPERKEFIEFQIQWWGDFLDLLRTQLK